MKNGKHVYGVGSICCLAACSTKICQTNLEQAKKQRQVSAQASTTKVKSVADFELTGVDGKAYRLSDFQE